MIAQSTHDGYTLKLTIGDGAKAFWMPINLVDNPELTLWQYVCDPDSGELVDFAKTEK